MAREAQIDLAPVLLVGGAALGIGTIIAVTKARAALSTGSVTEPAPGTSPAPPPGIPRPLSVPDHPDTSIPTPKKAPLIPRSDPPPYQFVLWTVRWSPVTNTWGQWDGPTVFSGRQLSAPGWLQREEWSEPADDVNDYLEAISSNNSAPGFFATYDLPITARDGANNPTAYGTPGPWRSGRFGDVTYDDGTHVGMYQPLTGNLVPGGVNTHWWG